MGKLSEVLIQETVLPLLITSTATTILFQDATISQLYHCNHLLKESSCFYSCQTDPAMVSHLTQQKPCNGFPSHTVKSLSPWNFYKALTMQPSHPLNSRITPNYSSTCNVLNTQPCFLLLPLFPYSSYLLQVLSLLWPNSIQNSKTYQPPTPPLPKVKKFSMPPNWLYFSP